MVAKRRTLRGAVARFADDLRNVTQQLNDGVSFLSRATQHKPCVGTSDFREVLSDMQDEVSELTSEVETLERFTVDAISFEELLGHSLELYQANRIAIELLEKHLQQYGYQQPPGLVREPENPVSAEALRGGDADSDAGDDGDDDRRVSLRAPAASVRHATFSKAPVASGRHREGKKATVLSPVRAAPSMARGAVDGSRRLTGRKGTPAGKRSIALPDSSASEDGDTRGHEAGSDGMDLSGEDSDEREARLRKHLPNQQQSWTGDDPAAGAPLGARPTGAMTVKGQLLAMAQTASWSAALTAATSVRASVCKSQRPSVDSRVSASPEMPLLSPSMAELLAKYNPPSDSDREPLSLSASISKSGLPDVTDRTPEPEDLSSAIRDLAPFGNRGPGLRAAAAAAVAVAPATVAGGSGGCYNGPAALPQQQQAHGIRMPPPPPLAEEDTCALYHELIRSQHVPTSLAPHQRPPQQQPQPPQQRPQVHIPQLKLGHGTTGVAAPQPASTSQWPPQQQQSYQPSGAVQQNHIPMQQSPRPPLAATPEKGAAASSGFGAKVENTPPPVPTASRSVTPLSIARANWQQHDRLLAEKMAGLEREWVESGQAARTPMRKSWGGFMNGESSGGAGAGIAAALERSRSPAPSRAAAEAAAAASLLASLAVPPAAGEYQAERQRQQGREEEPGSSRVLSPLQRVPQGGATAAAATTVTTATTPGRVTRSSSLPAPPATNTYAAAAAAAAATTVVGATMTVRRDGASDGSGRHTAAVTPKAAAAAVPLRGTPGRVPRASGIATPGKTQRQASSSPVTAVTSNRFTEAPTTTTPRAAARVTSTAAACAAEARASKLTTPHRKSFAAAGPDTALMAIAAEPSFAETPGKARRIASAAAAVTAAGVAAIGPGANRTPGRVRSGDAMCYSASRSQGQGPQAAVVAATAVVVPQLRLESCKRVEVGGEAWQGFPLSRRTEGGGGSTGPAEAPPAGGADDVTLAMPPSVSQPGTPTALTPGRGSQGGGAAVAAGSAVGVATSMLGGISPGTSQLVSRALGEGFVGQFRPAAAAGLVSRIPAPAAAAQPRTLSTALTASTTAGHPCSSSSGGAFGGGATTVAAAAVAAAAAAPLPSDLELCSEEEWRGLPARTQQAFPLAVLNEHLRALTQVVAARPAPSDLAAGRCFSVSDLEGLSLGILAAKLLMNTLVKLGRCEVAAGGIGAGGMLYRMRA